MTNITLDTSSSNMFWLNMVDHISVVGAAIVTFTTLEGTIFTDDDLWFNDVIQSSKSIFTTVPYILTKVNRFKRSMVSKDMFSKSISGGALGSTNTAQDQRMFYMVGLYVDTNILSGFGDMHAVNALEFRTTQG